MMHLPQVFAILAILNILLSLQISIVAGVFFDFEPPDATVTCIVGTSTAFTNGEALATNADGTQNTGVMFTDTEIPIGCDFPTFGANVYQAIRRSWTVTDADPTASPQTDMFIQSIFVTDDDPPRITNTPGNTNVQCRSDLNEPPGPLPATDDCTTSIQAVLLNSVYNPTGACGDGTQVNTWQATDECGKMSAEVTQTITVEDTTKPTFTAPDSVIVCPDAVPPAPLEITGDDNCDGVGSITAVLQDNRSRDGAPNCNGGTIRRTWRAIDACGNTSGRSQTITTRDDEGPTIAVPDDVELTCRNRFPTTPPAVAVTDNCDPPSTTTSFADDMTEPLPCVGDVMRTWTATDACGNTGTGTQKISIKQDTPPFFVNFPADETVCPEAPLPAVPADFTGRKCGVDLTPMLTETGTPGCNNVVTRSWTITDECLNTRTKAQDITFLDDTVPEFTVPVPTTVICRNQFPTNPPPVDVTDNCDADFTASFTDDTLPENRPCDGVVTRTWTATDKCGNTKELTQEITIEDTRRPALFNEPADEIVCPNAVPTAPDELDATDNCDGDLKAVLVQNSGTPGCTGQIITRRWRATDECGNRRTRRQEITTQDLEPPVIQTPPGFSTAESVQCADQVPAVGTLALTATDNCDADETITPVEVVTRGSCDNDVTIEFTWSTADDCGNPAEVVQTYTVLDDQNPSVTAPAGDAVQCPSDLVSPPATISATDNCDGNIGAILLNDVFTPDGSKPAACGDGMLVNTWQATDQCGNMSPIVSQTINVADTTNPVIDDYPDDITVECPGQVPDVPDISSILVSDNCDMNPLVSYDGESSDGQTCAETITRTWTVTDACGNTAMETQTITVDDTTNPTFDTGPETDTLECGIEQLPPVPDVEASDNCAVAVTLGFDVTSSESACPLTLTRTWTATDDCENEVTLEHVYTIEDTTPPVIDPAPAPLNLQCSANIPAAAPLPASDACDGDIDADPTDSQVDGACVNEVTITRTWNAADNCGNNALSVSQTIIVDDDTVPVIAGPVPAPVTVQCSSEVPTGPPTISAMDNCDGDLDAMLQEPDMDSPPGCGQDRTITRTWMAGDVCGNSATVTQTITVEDVTPPVIEAAPPAVTVGCVTDIPPAATLTATDNCGASFTAVVDDVATNPPTTCASNFVISRTWTAEDECGNEATPVIQTITILDDEAPVAAETIPAGRTVVCAADLPAAVPISVSDNCDATVSVDPVETIVGDLCNGIVTRTWSAEDSCGNSAVVGVQTIEIGDAQPPTFSVEPLDTTIECGDPLPTQDAVATDNCGGVTVVLTSEVAGGCPGVVFKTWTATDTCGNTAVTTQTITIADTTPPVLVDVPDDESAECDAVPDPADVTANDNSGASVQVAFSETSDGMSCPETITRTWSTIDGAGLTVSDSQTITVTDNTMPELIGTITDLTVECGNEPDPPVVTVSDNCDGDIDIEFSETTADQACGKIITRTWTATDVCDNEAMRMQTITVQDLTEPVITGVAPSVPSITSVECGMVPDAPPVEATDSCDGSVGVSFAETETGTPCSYTLLRTWSASDACDNEAEVVQTFSVTDSEPPTLDNLPASTISATCDAIPSPAGVTAFDSCQGAVPVVLEETPSGGACITSITRTWTATDGCGNDATSFTQTVTVTDDSDPVLVGVPADTTVVCGNVPPPPNVGATDNCDGSPAVTLVEDDDNGNCPGTYTRTWTATDACGRTASATQRIRLTDAVPPELAGVPDNETYECGDAIPDISTITVTATDNSDDMITVTDSQTTMGSCPEVITRTWSAEDLSNNMVSQSQTILVEDTTAPVLSGVPGDTNEQCDVPAVVAMVTATDVCDESVDVDFAESTDRQSCPEIVTRTWTATDECGNSVSEQQFITVNDDTIPVVTLAGVPVDITEECLDDVPEPPASIGATDNCATTIDAIYAGQEVSGLLCDQTIVRTWTATDDCGNEGSASQTIRVVDNRAPTLSNLPSSLTVTAECDEIPDAPIVTALDNCGLFIPSVTVSPPVLPVCGGTIERTWTASDECGNTATETQSISVTDSKAPVLSGVPPDTTVSCTAGPDAMATVTAVDTCPSSVVTIMTQEVDDPSPTACPRTVTRTWTASDGCGNSATGTQVIRVVDETPPTLVAVPDNVDLIECDMIPAVPDVEAFDNSGETLDVTFIEGSTPGSCTQTRTITRTWSAEDSSGNRVSEMRTIEAQDSTAPTFSNIPQAAITVECDSVPEIAAVTTSDNCDSNPTLVFAESSSEETCPTTLTRTWTSTDDCGNSASVEQQITVEDTTNPTFDTGPETGTLECGIEEVPPVPAVEASDNCAADLTVEFDVTSSGTTCSETLTRTWTATDDCDNEATLVHQYTIEDTTAPELSGVPANVEVQCDAIPATPLPDAVTASDACDGIVNVEFEEIGDGLACTATITRRWTASDACGRSTEAEQTISVTDNEPPVLVGVPLNRNVACEFIPPVPTNVIAIDNCDNDVPVSFVETVEGDCPGEITRTWTASDDCGNEVSQTQTIRVGDVVDPEILGVPERPVTVDCNNIPPLPSVSASDNSGVNIEVDIEVVETGTCPTVITRIYTAVDSSGNEAEETEVIIVADNAPPMLDGVPGNTAVQCFEDIDLSSTVMPSDNCDGFTFEASGLERTGSCPEIVTRSWTVTDACGLSLTEEQVITVDDTTAPVFVNTPPGGVMYSCPESVPAPGTLTAIDNCDGMLSVVGTDESDEVPCGETITRTWTATDQCGNFASVSQEITVSDAVAPMLFGVPPSAVVECDAIPDIPDNVGATDNCDGDIVVDVVEDNDATCEGTITRTWTATDICGNVAEQVQELTVQDTTPPVLVGVPAATTIECDTPLDSTLVTASDNCAPEITVETEVTEGTCPGSITRTWRATDDCGNTAMATQVITLVDTTPPILVGVPETAVLTVECDSIPEVPTVTVVDFATELSTPATFSETRTGACPDAVTIVRTWSGADSSNNPVSFTQTITAQDTTPPVFTTDPPNLTVECDAVPPATMPLATDNCDMSPNVEMMPVTVTEGCPRVETRTWTATDDCMNTATVSQEVTIVDTVAPVITGVGGDITQDCADPLPSSIGVSATDTCTGSLELNIMEENSSTCPKIITRTFTAVDECGNEAEETQKITLTDTTPPMLVGIPANAEVDCDALPPPDVVTVTDDCGVDLEPIFSESAPGPGCPYQITRTWTAFDGCNAPVSGSQILTVRDETPPQLVNVPPSEIVAVSCENVPDPPEGDVTATDTCDADPAVSVAVLGSDSCPGTITWLWTAVDNCGNTAEARTEIAVTDDTAPVITVPADATDVDPTETDPAFTGEATATDNCAGDVAITYQDTQIGNVVTRTWTATDVCGNTSQGTQTITLSFVIPPDPDSCTEPCDKGDEYVTQCYTYKSKKYTKCSKKGETKKGDYVFEGCGCCEDFGFTPTETLDQCEVAPGGDGGAAGGGAGIYSQCSMAENNPVPCGDGEVAICTVYRDDEYRTRCVGSDADAAQYDLRFCGCCGAAQERNGPSYLPVYCPESPAFGCYTDFVDGVADECDGGDGFYVCTIESGKGGKSRNKCVKNFTFKDNFDGCGRC